MFARVELAAHELGPPTHDRSNWYGAPQFFIMESGIVRVDLRLLDSAAQGGEALRQRLPPDMVREAPARLHSGIPTLIQTHQNA